MVEDSARHLGGGGLVVAAVHITAASWHTPHTAVCTLAHTTHSCLHHHGVQLLPPGWPHGSVFLLLRQEFHQLLPVLLTPCQHHTQSWVVIQYTVEALGCGGEGREGRGEEERRGEGREGRRGEGGEERRGEGREGEGKGGEEREGREGRGGVILYGILHCRK